MRESAPAIGERIASLQRSGAGGLQGLGGISALLADANSRLVKHYQPRGTSLFVEGDELRCVYFLLDGWAIRYRTLVEGRRQILDFALPNEFLGLIENRRAPHGCEMLTDGHIVAMSRLAFIKIAADRPELALGVATSLERSCARADDHIARIGQRSARLRVCQLLHELVTRLACERGGGRAVTVAAPLRQVHIADALGLRIESVCRVLVQLRAERIADLRHARLHVPDLRRLVEAAEAAPSEPAPAQLLRFPRSGAQLIGRKAVASAQIHALSERSRMRRAGAI